MFEITYEEIVSRLLNQVPDTLDKREGSIIYNALAPAAIEIMNLYDAMNLILEETFADTATKEYLIKRCQERGITMIAASPSVIKATFTPNTIDMMGYRFNCGSVNFIVTKLLSNGVYELTCETSGTVGNSINYDLIPIDYVEGLESATITELLIPGEEEEDTEDLRKRYFDSFSSQSFGGNVADYKEKVMDIDGIGGVKVYPTWNGGGTVKLVIQSGSFGAPSSDLISLVKEKMDPEANSGKGMGLAPIGHVVTVAGVTSQTISISATFSFSKSYVWDDVKANVQSAIDDYLQELNEDWDSCDNIIVRISQIESRMLNVEGVLDISNTKINNSATNLSVGADVVVVRGDMTNG